MPTRKFQGLAALLQIDAERDALEVRARAARTAAASELGDAVLDAVGLAFAPSQIAELLRAAQRLGFTEAMALMGAALPAHKVNNSRDGTAGNRRSISAEKHAATGTGHAAP